MAAIDISDFIKDLQSTFDTHYKLPENTPKVSKALKGSHYQIKYRRNMWSEKILAFVNASTGDIHLPGSYVKPSEKVYGNISGDCGELLVKLIPKKR